MRVLQIFLVVGVDPLLLMIRSLHRLLHQMVLGNRSKIFLHFSVVEDLITSYLFELHGVQLVLLLLLLLHHFGLSNLHFSLEIDLVNLVLIQSLEVVWFDSVRSQHAHLSLRVLSHEIVVISELELVRLLLCPGLVLLNLPLFFLLGHDLIDVVRVDLVLRPRLIVLVLRLLQQVIEFQGLLVEQLVNCLIESLLRLLLADLLLAPIPLL